MDMGLEGPQNDHHQNEFNGQHLSQEDGNFSVDIATGVVTAIIKEMDVHGKNKAMI